MPSDINMATITPLSAQAQQENSKVAHCLDIGDMHEQCMQLNVWLLIEIKIENTLGLMNEKSNSLKSHGVGVGLY